MPHMEIEVKFYLSDVRLTRKRIVELGAESRGRVFETNFRYEDRNKTLFKKRALLRLRKDRKNTLTFKSKPSDTDDQFKILNEIEVEVSDIDKMALILNALGFHKEQTYEKWRETFDFNGTILCIDTLPYGNFLEIEGKKDDIRQLAQAIGLNWEKRIVHSYLAIFEVLRNMNQLDFNDLTFENFKTVPSGLESCIHQFENHPL